MSFYVLRRTAVRPLLVKQELIGIASILSETVLRPHHQLISGGLFLARKISCHGSFHPYVYRERFQFIQREQRDAVRNLISDTITAHKSPFSLGVAHLRPRQVAQVQFAVAHPLGGSNYLGMAVEA